MLRSHNLCYMNILLDIVCTIPRGVHRASCPLAARAPPLAARAPPPQLSRCAVRDVNFWKFIYLCHHYSARESNPKTHLEKAIFDILRNSTRKRIILKSQKSPLIHQRLRQNKFSELHEIFPTDSSRHRIDGQQFKNFLWHMYTVNYRL